MGATEKENGDRGSLIENVSPNPYHKSTSFVNNDEMNKADEIEMSMISNAALDEVCDAMI